MKWTALQKMLPWLRGLQAGPGAGRAGCQMCVAGRGTGRKRQKLAEILVAKDQEVAAKDKELAAILAAKYQEVAKDKSWL